VSASNQLGSSNACGPQRIGTEWIAKRLQMGHPSSVSRQVGIVKRNKKLLKKLNELEKMCHCGD
jgi:hypothetical protein